MPAAVGPEPRACKLWGRQLDEPVTNMSVLCGESQTVEDLGDGESILISRRHRRACHRLSLSLHFGVARMKCERTVCATAQDIHVVKTCTPSAIMPLDRTARVAVLISGQVARFSYQHQQLHIASMQQQLAPTSICADVHIVLARTTYSFGASSSSSNAPPPQSPYAEAAALMDDAALRHHLLKIFRTRGYGVASSCRILSASELDAEMSTMDDAARAAAGSRLWDATAAMRAKTVHGNVVRWVHNGRMLYLRHLAMAAALYAEGRSGDDEVQQSAENMKNHRNRFSRFYSLFLVLREDNTFLEPERPLPAVARTLLHRRHKSSTTSPSTTIATYGGASASAGVSESVGAAQAGHAAPLAAPPPSGKVLLDVHCTFLGALSDKIAVTDRDGALALLGNSSHDHAIMLKSWLQFGASRTMAGGGGGAVGSASSRAVRSDPMQSEAFLVHSLKAKRVSVRGVAFARTDVRFEARGGGEGMKKTTSTNENWTACVRPLYYACGPQVLRAQRRLPMCVPSTRHERELVRKLRVGGV